MRRTLVGVGLGALALWLVRGGCECAACSHDGPQSFPDDDGGDGPQSFPDDDGDDGRGGATRSWGDCEPCEPFSHDPKCRPRSMSWPFGPWGDWCQED